MEHSSGREKRPMSHSQPASPRIDLAALRHQLLTPLNHIVGYSEMLLEDGEAQGFDSAQQNLVRIRETARDMVRTVQSSLAPHPGKRGDKIVDELRYQLAAPLHTILQALGAVTGECREGVNVPDVLKIGRAAAELLSFAAGAVAIPGTPPQRKAAPRTREKGRAGRILVVDDNRGNRELLARQLRQIGHQVTEASSGSQALQMLVQSSQDLVLLDMLMPKLDGFQVLERIKNDPQRAGTPVIVLSALNEVPGVIRCLEIGAEDYLFKPIDPALLAARIQTSLERKALREAEKQRAIELEGTRARLRYAESRLELVLRATRGTLWEWDPKTDRVISAAREEPLDRALARVHPNDRERLRAAAERALEKRTDFHCEFRALRRSGVQWMRSVGFVENGRMIGVTSESAPPGKQRRPLWHSDKRKRAPSAGRASRAGERAFLSATFSKR
jgi:CheY-like chemotaxis protein